MTSNPRVVRPDTLAGEAALAVMVEQDCHHLPVVDENCRPVGLVGMRAVVSETFGGCLSEATTVLGIKERTDCARTE